MNNNIRESEQEGDMDERNRARQLPNEKYSRMILAISITKMPILSSAATVQFQMLHSGNNTILRRT